MKWPEPPASTFKKKTWYRYGHAYRITQLGPASFCVDVKTLGGFWARDTVALTLAAADEAIAEIRARPPREPKYKKPPGQKAKEYTGASLAKIRENCRNGERLPEPDNVVRGPLSRLLFGFSQVDAIAALHSKKRVPQ